jgi:putative Mg2+ transporter-C (MgtC) family protein
MSLTWGEVALRLGVAALLGALVGLEREASGQDAGFRTHLLLALGAALFGAMSVGAFDDLVGDADTNVRLDPSRIASYVAAGVGFLGGGAILKHAGAVRGITTAASIWAAAAIGLSAGLGFWPGAIIGTLVALVALAALKPLSDFVDRRANRPRTMVVTLDRPGAGSRVLRVIEDAVAPAIKLVQLGGGHDDHDAELRVEFWAAPEGDVVDRLAARLTDEFGDDVRSVSIRR